MAYHKTNAIVLKKVDYGDSSLILTAFSREFGKVALSAKGIKRALSTFESPPETFTVQQFVFSRRGATAMATASESALLEEFRGLRRDIARFYAACYAGEVLLSLCPEWEPMPALYDLALAALREMDRGEAVVALFRFEAGALALLGHAPVLERCTLCSKPRKKAERVTLSAKSGGYVCGECATHAAGPMMIQGGTAAAMALLLGARAEKARSLRLGAKALLDLQRAFDYLFVFLRGRPFRAMPLLEGMLKGR